MAEIRIEITRDLTGEKLAKLDETLEQFVKDGAAVIEGNLKASMAEPKTGRAYKRGSKVHIASARGESPAVDSGNLTGSIQQIFPSTLEGLIGTNVEYAIWLEDPDGLNRPLWQKTADDSLPTLEKMLKDAVAAI